MGKRVQCQPEAGSHGVVAGSTLAAPGEGRRGGSGIRRGDTDVVHRLVGRIHAAIERKERDGRNVKVLKLSVDPEILKHPELERAISAALAHGIIVALPEPFTRAGEVAAGDWDVV